MHDDVHYKRLSHFEWANTVHDLTGVDASDLAARLRKDSLTGFDNDNSGAAFDVTTALWQDYQRPAEQVAARATSDATSLATLTAGLDARDVAKAARAFVDGFARRAYRRPLDAIESDELVKTFRDAGVDATAEAQIRAGVGAVIEAVLQSPYFVYRDEHGTTGPDGKTRLTGHAWATRIAYALTGSMPDANLSENADHLTDADVQTQAERLLATPAADALVRHLYGQLYELRRFDPGTKSASLVPASAIPSAADVQREDEQFLSDVFTTNGGLAAILTSPTAYAGARSAALYGVPASTSGMGRVTLPAASRSGLLSHVGFLATYASANDPDPIHRGLFVAQRILCRVVPPPAANVTTPSLDPAKTNRQRIEAHTGRGTCGQSCHAVIINPLGFAFEGYDAIGRLRAEDAGQPIDSRAQYKLSDDGATIDFADAPDLMRQLAATDDAHACHARGLASYLAAGAPSHDEALAALTQASQQGASTRRLLRDTVTSPAFREVAP